MPNCRRIFGAQAPHPTPGNPHPTTAISRGPRDLAALLLRSSLTQQRMGSLRSSAQTHDLGHLDTESLAANRHHSSRTSDAARGSGGRWSARVLAGALVLQFSFGLVYVWGAMAPYVRAHDHWPPLLIGAVWSAGPAGYG